MSRWTKGLDEWRRNQAAEAALPMPKIHVMRRNGQKKTYWISGHCTSSTRLMVELTLDRANRPEDADFIVFTGGADINPALYGDIPHPTTSCDLRRDLIDGKTWAAVQNLPSIKLGLCRGGQFLNVKSGGGLWQHIDNHTGGFHTCRYMKKDGTTSVWLVNSIHHQMMMPGKEAELWGETPGNLCTFRDFGSERKRPVDRKDGSDYEILWYPKTRSLCFQAHPEYGHKPTTTLWQHCLQRAIEAVGT